MVNVARRQFYQAVALSALCGGIDISKLDEADEARKTLKRLVFSRDSATHTTVMLHIDARPY